MMVWVDIGGRITDIQGARMILAAPRCRQARGRPCPLHSPRRLPYPCRGVDTRELTSAGGGRKTPMDANEIIWRPDPETASRTRIARFMRAHGLATLEDLQRRSVEDLEWYWSAVVRDLGWAWTAPYQKVVDTSRGIQWPRWFVGGRMNLTAQCVDVHVAAGHGDKPAVISEAEDGGVRTLTYAELAREVGRLANALTRLGVGPGDTVGIFLPMSQEAAVAVLAVTRIGAVYAPCFSGYGAQAVAARLTGCDAKVLITADAFARRGNADPDEAHRRRGGGRISLGPARDRAPADRRRHSVDAGPRRLVARGGGDRAGGVRSPGRRGRSSGPDHLHVGDHGASEGHRAHAGRLRDQERARLGLRLRHGRPRPHVLGHRPRLAHGPDAHHGHAAPRRDAWCSSRARPTIRSPIASGSSASAIASRISASRRRPRARSCPTAPTGSPSTISRRSASSARRASRGTPSPFAGSSSMPAAGVCRSSTTRAAPRSRAASSRRFPSRPSSRAPSAGRSRGWRPSASARTAGRCAARWASSSSRSPGRE